MLLRGLFAKGKNLLERVNSSFIFEALGLLSGVKLSHWPDQSCQVVTMGSGYWRSATSMLGSNSLGFLSHQIDPKIVPCLFFSSMIITNTYFINIDCQAMIEVLHTQKLTKSIQPPFEGGTIIVPILQMKKLRHREIV